MLPMNALRGALQGPALVELKSGESYNGTLEAADFFMNLKLSHAVMTSPDGSAFFSMDEVYLRGNSVKSLRFAEDVLEKAAAATCKTAVRGRTKARGQLGRVNRGGFKRHK